MRKNPEQTNVSAAPVSVEAHASSPAALTHPSFGEAFRFWLKLGFISFGGPTGQIAIMHAQLVEKKRWISENRFLHALNYCMLLPGPEAQQLATYIGWLLHKTAGGIAAGALFVLPSAVLLWVLSYVYVVYGEVQMVSAFFYGLKPAVMAIVVHAVIRIGKRALKNEMMWGFALCAFIALFFFKLPFPLIIFAAAALGFVGGRLASDRFVLASAHKTNNSVSVIDDHDASPLHTKPTLVRALNVLSVCLALWFAPLIATALSLGTDSVLFREGIFFSKAAMVTFGGAYAVLPYVSQQAVEHYGWLSAPQMLDGLGLAETTPGPLIMVLQFVGFLGGWQHPPGMLSPLLSATLGALMTTWTTFVPCFLWIFLGAPHIEQLRDNRHLNATLSVITAAVVGVVLNLAVWFGMHVIVPSAGVVDWFALAVGLVAFVGLVRWQWNVVWVVIAGGIIGVCYKWVTG